MPVDLRAVVDPSIDPLIPGGRLLVGFVDAVLSGRRIGESGDALQDELGERARVDAAAVIGNFQMMNRIADATGMPVSGGARARHAGLIEELGFDRFDHL